MAKFVAIYNLWLSQLVISNPLRLEMTSRAIRAIQTTNFSGLNSPSLTRLEM
jgi:hypothetical protein